MKAIFCAIVAFLATVSCAQKPCVPSDKPLPKEDLQLDELIRGAYYDGSLQAILKRMMANGKSLDPRIINILNYHCIPIPKPSVPSTPVNWKYQFKGMDKLSNDEMRAITIFLDEFFREQDEEVRKFQPPKLKIRVPRQACKVDDDCPFQQFCFDISEELSREMTNKGFAKYYSMVMTALDIQTKECSPRMADLLVNDVDSYMENLRTAFNRISSVFEKTHKIRGMERWLQQVEVKIFKNFNFTTHVEKALADKRQEALQRSRQQGFYGPQQYVQQPYYPQGQGQYQYQAPYPYPYPQPVPEDDGLMSILPLLLLGNLGGTGGSGDLTSMLPLLLLSGGSGIGGGIDDDGLLSPLLLVSLMGMGGGNDLFSGGNSLMTILLATTLLGSEGGDDGFILPFLLIMMQNMTGGGSTDPLGGLLPILLLGGLGGGGGSSVIRSGHDVYCPQGQNSIIDVLLLSSLFNTNNNNNNNLNQILLFSVLQDSNCPGSGGIGPVELLLIQSLQGGNSNSLFGNNSLALLLVLGGLGSGGGFGSGGSGSGGYSSGIDPALLLLVLGNGGNTNTGMNSLLPILFLSDSNFADNPLALLLLFNNNLLNGTGDNNMLFLLLALSGGNAGITGSGSVTVPQSISRPYQNIPPPGSAPGVLQQTYPQQSTGLFGGVGNGNGLFEYIIISNLLGGGSTMNNEVLLMILILQGGLFGSPQPQPQPQPVYPISG